MNKKPLAVLIAIAIVIGAVLITNNKKSEPASTNISPTNHVDGSSKTGVRLVEYGDYASPACNRYFFPVLQVTTMYANQIQFQFRNLPQTRLHPDADAGAQAAEAAGLQGEFWRMNKTLYYNQNSWTHNSAPERMFDFYAQALGLNISQFTTDYDSVKVKSLIEADKKAFDKTGSEVTTPTFFLDGKRIQPSASVTDLETYINAAIRQKGFTPAPQPNS